MHLVVQRQRVVAPAPVVADARPAIDDQRVDLPAAPGARRSRARPGRRRPPGPSARDRAYCADGFALVEPVRPGEIARIRFALGRAAGRPAPRSPFSSSSAVSSVHALGSSSGSRRTTPLPRPARFRSGRSPRCISCPRASHARGGVRSGSIRKPAGLRAPACVFSAAAIASAPLTVRMSQVRARTSRQWLSA